MVSEQKVLEAIELLEGEISADRQIVFPGFPREAYTTYLRDVRSHLGFARHPLVSPRRTLAFRRVLARYDEDILRRFNKLSLAMSMRGSLKRLPETELPPEIRDLFDRWFCRVLADFKRQPDSYYSLGNRDFICDLSVCCLVTIPVGGAWGVHVSRAGVGPLRRGFPLQTMSYLGQLLGQTRGWSPFCVVHTFGRYVLRISPEALEGAYARTAELMKRNPRIKGIYRRSWMLDPALAGISPHLSYMREVPQRHGARFFRCPAGETDIRGALTGSAFRSRLYEEGKYRPTVYAFVWPRASVLEWAHTRRDKGDLSGSGYDSRSDDRGHMTRGATEAGNGGITPGVEKLET